MNKKQIVKSVAKPISIIIRAHGEFGGAMVMVYLSILMFLYIAILFLDITYQERIGRSIQRSVDAAALAGAIQLTNRSNTNESVRQQGWLNAKKAVFAIINQNKIAGAEGLYATVTQNTSGGSASSGSNSSSSNSFSSISTIEELDGPYRDQIFTYGSGAVGATLTIERGVYERPFKANGTNPDGTTKCDYISTSGFLLFHPMEGRDTHDSTGRCIRRPAADQNYYPTACDPSYCSTSGHYITNDACKGPVQCHQSGSGNQTPKVWDVADSVRVTLSVGGMPTLFAKLLGFDSVRSITRVGVSGQE